MSCCIATFTCARDAPLMPIHAAAIRRILPTAGLLYITPEGEQSAFPSGALHQYRAQLITSTWPRGDRLSGAPAIIGILETLAAIARATSLPIIKLDTDTILRRADWLTPIHTGAAHYIGFESWQPSLPTGACYALSPTAAAAMAAAANPWPWRDSTDHLPEDRTIYLTALRTLGSAAHLIPWNPPAGQPIPPRVLGFDPIFHRDPEHIPPHAAAIHCAEHPQLHLWQQLNLNRTHQVARAMRAALRSIPAKKAPR